MSPGRRDATTYRAAFGQRIRDLRKAAGIGSQEALALKAGLNRTYVGDVERGERNIALDNILRLAVALGVDPSALLPDPTRAQKREASRPRKDQ